MKMQGEIDNLNGRQTMSQMQHRYNGILDSVAQIVRMVNSKVESRCLKKLMTSTRIEFADLQKQFYDLGSTQFNGEDLFKTAATTDGTTAATDDSFERDSVVEQLFVINRKTPK